MLHIKALFFMDAFQNFLSDGEILWQYFLVSRGKMAKKYPETRGHNHTFFRTVALEKTCGFINIKYWYAEILV